ncbi:MAG TPA: metalloregulator ArsR/SmtB family transcription factor [Terriglobales bacterium]|jgi:DNA-binding transcriptional ArsR family regulator|nr:metalloregulator ArsR/SmtB family transcription factor [Terriglobales bacterium]
MRHRSVTYSKSRPQAAGSPQVSGFSRGTGSPDAAFSALADPTRRAVLDLLRAGTRPAGDIARAFTVSRPAISKHLSILRRAHLVEERREGRHRLYQLNPEPLREVDTWLEQYRQFWTASLNNLKAFVEAEYAKETAAQAHQQEPKKEK